MEAGFSDNFSSTGVSAEGAIKGDFNVEVVFSNSGTIELQRELGRSGVWVTVETITETVSKRGFEAEFGVLYRFNCTAIIGTATVRISN